MARTSSDSRTSTCSPRCSKEPGSPACTWRRSSFGLEFEDRDELWDGLAAGAVRLRPLILGQTEELQRQIRTRYDELLEAYRTETGSTSLFGQACVGTKA